MSDFYSMRKVGVFVGERGNWTFFNQLYADLCEHYQVSAFQPRTAKTPVFRERVNRHLYARSMRDLLEKSDVCFFEWASELLVPASHLPKGGAIVTRLHSYEVFFWAPRINWDHVDRVILVSEAMRRRFAALYPEHARKATVVYHGADLQKFRPPGRRRFGFNIGMLAGIHPVKRIYEMVLTVHTLKQRGYSPCLHIGGGRVADGYHDDYYNAIVGAIRKLDLAESVTMHDQVSDAATWLQGIDVFVSNSYWEGQQVALLEALASGCICLSHFWDGAEEIVPVDCLYVTGEDLQQKLIELAGMNDDQRWMQQQQMRAIACEKFDLERQRREVRQVIEEAVGG